MSDFVDVKPAEMLNLAKVVTLTAMITQYNFRPCLHFDMESRNTLESENNRKPISDRYGDSCGCRVHS
jgi:hypothetical protein